MNIYFSGIGGVGVGPLAMLAQDAGHNVFGSDREKSQIYDDLLERGIELSTDQSGKFMREVNEKNELDLLIYSSAIPEDHPEIIVAREYGITTAKRDDLLNQLIEYKSLKLLAISGTHGKTSTTGIVIWVMKKLGIPVSYSIGTRLSFGPAAKYEKDSQYFVYEADEFDKNMLKFNPFMAVITSLDFDHSDTYKDKADYHDSFQQFINQSDSAIAWQDSGLSGNNLTLFDKVSPEITLPGEHNKANGTLVLGAFKKLLSEQGSDEVLSAINSFPGTSRRFEELLPSLYTDYAHHPVEIASTIDLARESSDNVVIIYQPHQNIRQHQLVESGGYKDTFRGANKVYWLSTYLSREDEDLDVLTPEELIETADKSSEFIASEMNEKLAENIRADLESGSMVIAMAAGDLDGWVRDLADNI